MSFSKYFSRGIVPTLALAVIALTGSCSRHGTSGREVWARVDGTPIYRDQAEAVYRRRIAALPGSDKPEQALSFKLNILNQLIDHQILLERAAQLQITVSDQEVDARLSQIRSPYSAADFRSRLAKQGVTPGELRQQVRDEITIQKLVQKEITSNVNVTPDEIARYYSRNKADFNVPQTEYHLAQILVTPVPDPQVRNLMNDDARNAHDAARKIKALQALLQTGESFAKVAEEYSEDPRTAPGGGDMGFVPESSFSSDRTVAKALKSLKTGQVSGVIRERSAYRIFKLLGKEDAGQRSPSDARVQDTIRRTLADEKEEVLKAAYVETLRNQAHVVDYLAQGIIKDNGAASAAR